MSPTAAALVLAYAAIILLGLAVGGLMRQVRHLQAHESGRSAAVLTRADLVGGEAPSLGATNGGPRKGPYWALFASHTCSACELIIPGALEAFESATDTPILVLSDQPIDVGVRFGGGEASIQTVVDPGASQRFGVQALPWVVAVDSSNQIVVSEPLGSSQRMRTLLATIGSEVLNV